MFRSTRQRRLLTTLLLLHVEAKALAIPWRRGQNAVQSLRLNDVGNTTVFAEQDYVFNDELERRRSKRILAPLPTRFFRGAKAFFGRAASAIFDRRSSIRIVTNDEDADDDGVDHTFDDLDQIIDKTSSNETDESLLYHDDNLLLDTFSSLMTGQRRQRRRMLVLRKKKPPVIENSSFMQSMEEKLLSSETIKAIQTIRDIVERFPEHGIIDLFGLYTMKDIFWSLVAFSKLQHALEFDNNEDDDTDYKTAIVQQKLEKTISFDIDELAHYCSFASAAYGWKGFAFCGKLKHPFGGNYRVLARSTGIDRGDIVTANWHSKANLPAYYIARNTKRKALVLSIRGSLSPRDILTDLCASAEDFFVEDVTDVGEIDSNTTKSPPPLIRGRAHKGMVDAARRISVLTGRIITDELATNPDYTLIIVGHSLGGGVASIITAMWHRRFQNRIRAIAYASPCTFPLNNTKVFDSTITSIVGSGDPFARFSLGHLADLTKTIAKLCQDTGLRDEILKRTTGKVDADDHIWCTNVMIFLRKLYDSEKLVPPGKILRLSGPLLEVHQTISAAGNKSRGIHAGSDTIASLVSVEPTRFNELKLHPRMFDVSLHIPLRYETLLRRLASLEEKA